MKCINNNAIIATSNAVNNHNNNHVSPSSNVHVSIVMVTLNYVKYINAKKTQVDSTHTRLVYKTAKQMLVKAKAINIESVLVPVWMYIQKNQLLL